MNICTPGNCICDAAEWAGDTDCFGNVQGTESETVQTYTRRLYYLNTSIGYDRDGYPPRAIVFSVDDPSPEEMRKREFYADPELTIRVTEGGDNMTVPKNERQNPDGSWSEAEESPMEGWKANLEQNFYRWGFPRLGRLMGRWDERNLGK